MLWIANGRCACFCFWRRLAARNPSGRSTLMRSPPHTVRILRCLHLQTCHSHCTFAEMPMTHSSWQVAFVCTNVQSLRAGDPLWWPQKDTELLQGTRLGAAAEHHAENVRQLGAWRQQLCDLQAELGGPNILQVILIHLQACLPAFPSLYIECLDCTLSISTTEDPSL